MQNKQDARANLDSRPIYESPRALRLGDMHTGAGGTACIPGSGDGGDCFASGNSAGLNCDADGNTPGVLCTSTGSGFLT